MVIGSTDPAFFELTKRIHNLIHGTGDPEFSESDRKLCERVNRENADALRELVRPGDVLVVHDPQPLPIARYSRDIIPLTAVWRSHIGLDAENAATQAAWGFLGPKPRGLRRCRLLGGWSDGATPRSGGPTSTSSCSVSSAPGGACSRHW